MPNAHFDFKQFRVVQDRCAMKVSTDACIQGAWLARVWQSEPPAAILDIGTGTGLLSLMLAQALPEATIAAIEINEEAYQQAVENVQQCPWPDRISLRRQALQETDHAVQYDAIICNPPFFHNHLESQDEHRSMARHSHTLSKELLAAQVSRLLSPGGTAGILYPASEWESWEKIAALQGLYLQRQLLIKPHARKAPNRVVGLMGKHTEAQAQVAELCIYEAGSRDYTPAFIDLLNPYYLHL